MRYAKHWLIAGACLGWLLGCGNDEDDADAAAGTGGSAGSGAGSGGKGGGSGGKGGSANAGKGGGGGSDEPGGSGSTADAGEPGEAGSGGTSSTGDSLCERGCEATLAADCPAGPQSQDQCVEDCEELSSGACSSEYTALQACAEGEEITCGSSGIPVIESCSSEQTAFIACLNR